MNGMKWRACPLAVVDAQIRLFPTESQGSSDVINWRELVSYPSHNARIAGLSSSLPKTMLLETFVTSPGRVYGD
jgi:hypothetical protein